jgi:hypothetical protein
MKKLLKLQENLYNANFKDSVLKEAVQLFYDPDFYKKINQNPYLIKGMISGNNPIHISRDPTQTNYIVLPRSNNKSTGLEFTWSLWLNLSVVNSATSSPTYMHVFNVGNNIYDGKTGIATVNNGPGVYLTQDLQSGTLTSPTGFMTLYVIMDSESVTDVSSNTSVEIEDIPYNKWFHVALRMENTTLDVYVNGVITQRITYQNTPKQNYNDIYLSQNGGFNGNISNLQYFSRALNVFDINSIVYWGPNLSSPLIAGSSAKDNLSKLNNYNYISSNWYFNKMGADLMQF